MGGKSLHMYSPPACCARAEGSFVTVDVIELGVGSFFRLADLDRVLREISSEISLCGSSLSPDMMAWVGQMLTHGGSSPISTR